MKKYIYLIISFLFLLLPVNVFGIVNPTSNFFVNDYANILSSETEEYIFNKSVKLYDIDGTQIVVVTVQNLEGYSLEEYANRLFNSWELGDKDENNALLLLLALEEREFRVEVGDGLGGILPDAKTGRFQDEYMIPYFKNNDWDNGIKNGYDAFYSEIVKLNNLDLDYVEPEETDKYNSSHMDVIGIELIFNLFFPSMFIAVLFGNIIKKMKKTKRRRATKVYFIVWGILFLICIIYFKILIILLGMNLMLFIVSRYGELSSSSGGGFYRGSSSGSSRSSSSRSFSGGGGRSSGGGSSRRF